MSSKQPRHSPSPTLPQHATSKLPKFLQKQNRDRSKSVNEPIGSPSASSIGSSTSSAHEIPPTPSSKIRKGSRFLGRKDKDKDSSRSPETGNNDKSNNSTTTDMDEPPVIVEPVAIPRPRNHTDRPTTSAPDSLHNPLYSSTPSTRIGDLPTRLSGWFSHTFSSSTTDLSLPSLLSQSSPKSKAAAFLTAAKHGKGHLDKAMRYILDSDATPDRCTDPIWLLGVQHPGYEPPSPVSPQATISTPFGHGGRRASGSPPSFRSSTSSVASNAELALSLSQSNASKYNPAALWPPVFYIDFVSRIWLTYRSHFSQPIKDTALSDLCGGEPGEAATSPIGTKSRWHWGGEKSWNTDSGWGCMLRTGQSLLANSLIHVHLGREWRKPPYPVYTADYATYVQILTWFLDTPSPEAPFSVHRMALAGKELGTDVGQWFGPSVAAGAIKRLTNAFPGAGLGVSVAKDGVLSQTDVYASSYTDLGSRSPKKNARSTWGDRPVLVLIGLRLGIDGVNPIYYETIKSLFTFPQSVGIAGGRPGSSYYFVGSQADNLFYLDPHHARSAIPLRPPPSPSPLPPIRRTSPDLDREKEVSKWTRKERSSSYNSNNNSNNNNNNIHSQSAPHARAPTSPSSVRTGSSTFSYHAPVSPSPLQQQFSTSSTDSGVSASSNSSFGLPPLPPPPSSRAPMGTSVSAPGTLNASARVPGSPNSDLDLRDLGTLPVSPSVAGPIPVAVMLSQSSSGTSASASSMGDKGTGGLDMVQEHYVTAYSATELKTFHCERVRKMPLSGLDPSMLLGFLCRDEGDWMDLKRRVEELPRSIFAIQNEHPNWSSSDFDDTMGLESMSEPDDLEVDLDDEEDVAVIEDSRKKRGGSEEDEEDEEEEEEEEFFEAGSRSRSGSTSASSHSRDKLAGGGRGSTTSEADTEEDPVEALTPGPQSRFDLGVKGKGRGEGDGGDDEGSDIEDDWVDSGDPGVLTPMQASATSGVGEKFPPPSPSPSPSPTLPELPPPVVAPVPVTNNNSKSKSKTSSRSSHANSKMKSSEGEEKEKRRKKERSKKQVPVLVPLVRLPSAPGESGGHRQQQQQESYPFPGTGGDDDLEEEMGGGGGSGVGGGPGTRSWERGRYESQSWAGPPSAAAAVAASGGAGVSGSGFAGRMFAGKGRDGGRTQSGGVKGVLTDR